MKPILERVGGLQWGRRVSAAERPTRRSGYTAAPTASMGPPRFGRIDKPPKEECSRHKGDLLATIVPCEYSRRAGQIVGKVMAKWAIMGGWLPEQTAMA